MKSPVNYFLIVTLLFIYACQKSSGEIDIPEEPSISTKEQQQLIEALKNGESVHYLRQKQDRYTIHLAKGDAITLIKEHTPLITKSAQGYWMINGIDTEIKCTPNATENTYPDIINQNGYWYIDSRQTPLQSVSQEGEVSANTTFIQCILQTLHHIVFYLSDGSILDINHTNNPPLDFTKPELRVLDIGNSYTEDATHYLPSIVKAAKIDVSDMCLYKAIRGGGSYKNWYNIYHDIEQYGYYISKVLGGLSAKVSGSGMQKEGAAFRMLLAENEWDLIIIHQYSVYAPYYDEWNTDEAGGYLPQLLELIRSHQPNATIGLLLIHSYWSGYSGNKEHSSLRRWKLIAQSTKQFCEAYNSDFIIPYGTAIQNMRSSSLNNEYDMTADGSHCASGLADYTAACCYFQALFAPRYNTTIVGNAARWSNANNEEVKYQSSIIEVNDHTASVAQQAAALAVENPYLMYEL